jgi:hypothetical protein
MKNYKNLMQMRVNVFLKITRCDRFQILAKKYAIFLTKKTRFILTFQVIALAIGTLRPAVRRAEQWSAGGVPERNDRRRAADGSRTRMSVPFCAATSARSAAA